MYVCERTIDQTSESLLCNGQLVSRAQPQLDIIAMPVGAKVLSLLDVGRERADTASRTAQ